MSSAGTPSPAQAAPEPSVSFMERLLGAIERGGNSTALQRSSMYNAKRSAWSCRLLATTAVVPLGLTKAVVSISCAATVNTRRAPG